jgi:hypothetical protein
MSFVYPDRGSRPFIPDSAHTPVVRSFFMASDMRMKPSSKRSLRSYFRDRSELWASWIQMFSGIEIVELTRRVPDESSKRFADFRAASMAFWNSTVSSVVPLHLIRSANDRTVRSFNRLSDDWIIHERQGGRVCHRTRKK